MFPDPEEFRMSKNAQSSQNLIGISGSFSVTVKADRVLKSTRDGRSPKTKARGDDRPELLAHHQKCCRNTTHYKRATRAVSPFERRPERRVLLFGCPSRSSPLPRLGHSVGRRPWSSSLRHTSLRLPDTTLLLTARVSDIVLPFLLIISCFVVNGRSSDIRGLPT